MFFKFGDEIHYYQKFVCNNIKFLGNLIIISEQLIFKHTNDKIIIDILALDLTKKQLVIIELKNIKVKEPVIGQIIKYYDHIIRAEDELKDLLKLKKDKINFDINDINLNPLIMIVVPDFKKSLIRSLSYIDQKINIELIKLNAIQRIGYYEAIKEKQQVSRNQTIHKKDLVSVNKKISKQWSFEEYLKEGVDEGKVQLAKQFIEYFNSLKLGEIQPFFHEKKITLMDGKDSIVNIFIKKNMFDDSLDVSIQKGGNFHYDDLNFDPYILGFNVKSRVLHIKFNKVPTNFLRKNYIN
ncbi:MAG: hypothetical protein ACOCP8_01805 [archaeon]